MDRTTRFARWAGTRASRRLLRAIPYVGALVAAAYVTSNMRRKGALRGAIDSGIDAIPFVGGAKIVAETLLGRELIGERRARR